MPDKPSEGGFPSGDLGRAARELADRFQVLADRLHGASQAGLDTVGQGVSGAVKPWLSFLEATTAQTAVPIIQLQTLVDGIRAQREQVRALQSQLAVFDKQLAAMEHSLQPLAAWGQQWVRVQESVLGQVRNLTQPDQ